MILKQKIKLNFLFFFFSEEAALVPALQWRTMATPMAVLPKTTTGRARTCSTS
jgi:hypothetical protein